MGSLGQARPLKPVFPLFQGSSGPLEDLGLQRDVHQLREGGNLRESLRPCEILYLTFGTEMGPEPGSPISQRPDFKVMCVLGICGLEDTPACFT